MSDTRLTSRYLFNEIPDYQQKIDEFGHKAFNLSLAKKWQFAVPDTAFLSGDLVKEIVLKKRVPAAARSPLLQSGSVLKLVAFVAFQRLRLVKVSFRPPF